MNEIEFSRKCPSCNVVLYYKDKWYLKDSINKNRKCRKCSKIGYIPSFIKEGKISFDVLEKMKKSWFKKGSRPKNADFRKGKTISQIYGENRAKELKIKLSNRRNTDESNIKRRNSCIKSRCGYSNKGRKTSDELKKLFRKQMVERLSKTNKNFHPSYNERACEYFDVLSKSTGNTIRHALNGGEFHIKELGYWVDGYDEENNIVYEWDERYHFNKDGILKRKDILRENEIKAFLKCEFVRIRDSSSTLTNLASMR